MDRHTETRKTWDKIALLYQDKFMDLDIYDRTYDFVCESIPAGKAKLLEVGCGPGNVTRYLLSKRPELDIFGIDMAPNMIALAKNNNPTVVFDVMDCRQISLLKTTFDGIVCGFCMPYLSPVESDAFIADCYHLLNENGFLYISFVEGDPAESGYQTVSSGDRVYFYFYNLDDLVKQFADNNFDVIKVFKVPFKKSESGTEAHMIVTARKI